MVTNFWTLNYAVIFINLLHSGMPYAGKKLLDTTAEMLWRLCLREESVHVQSEFNKENFTWINSKIFSSSTFSSW